MDWQSAMLDLGMPIAQIPLPFRLPARGHPMVAVAPPQPTEVRLHDELV